MTCPICKSDTDVIDTRNTLVSTRRRRKCMACSHLFTTYEVRQKDFRALQTVKRRKAQTAYTPSDKRKR